MSSETVSIRLPKEILKQIDRLAEEMAIERMTIIRRLIKVGVEGLVRYENSGEPADWPREGRMQLEIQQISGKKE